MLDAKFNLLEEALIWTRFLQRDQSDRVAATIGEDDERLLDSFRTILKLCISPCESPIIAIYSFNEWVFL